MIEQEIVLNRDLTGTWRLKSESMDFTREVFDDLALLAGHENAGILIDDAIFNSSEDLDKRSDIDSFNLTRFENLNWKSEIRFNNIESLLGESANKGIARLTSKGKSRILELRFNRTTASSMEELIPLLQEPAFYIFNPGATVGITEEEYITDYLGYSFGQQNIPGIRLSRISMTIEVPGPITKIVSGEKIGPGKAAFETSLSRLMVPDKEIFWAVSWEQSE